MQPETKSTPYPGKQWDQVAASLISKTLAPKGFHEVKRGPYRGKIVANVPFLQKPVVDKCCNLAAQLVRSFREAARKDMEAHEAFLDNWRKETEAEIKDCRFWQFRKKGMLKSRMSTIDAQRAATTHCIGRLNLVTIK